MPSSEILNLSKLLFNGVDPKDGPMIKNIIGRAYYSCFHKLKETAKDKYNWSESQNVKGGTHEKLISRLDNIHLTDSTKMKLAAQIQKNMILLKKKRVTADYYVQVLATKLDASYCIATAEKIHEMLDDL